MYTLNEYLPIFVGDDLPEKGWDSGMYCLETDRAKILRSNLLRGFVGCFADTPSFSKFFSRLSGMSPKEYRMGF